MFLFVYTLFTLPFCCSHFPFFPSLPLSVCWDHVIFNCPLFTPPFHVHTSSSVWPHQCQQQHFFTPCPTSCTPSSLSFAYILLTFSHCFFTSGCCCSHRTNFCSHQVHTIACSHQVTWRVSARRTLRGLCTQMWTTRRAGPTTRSATGRTSNPSNYPRCSRYSGTRSIQIGLFRETVKLHSAVFRNAAQCKSTLSVPTWQIDLHRSNQSNCKIRGSQVESKPG